MTAELNISRRTVLAGLGTIGIASAGAGLGTTAYFRDEESVAAELEAGRLDVKMDYRASYNAWLPPAETDALVDGPVIPDPDNETGVIVGQAPDVRNGDGGPVTGEEWAAFTRASDACVVDDETSLMTELVRVSGQTGTAYSYETDGADDYLGPKGQIYVDGETGLMFDLTDVKPKDEGEATVSIHTCGNPAYLWLNATVDDEVTGENGVIEPEVSLDDTDDAAGELANYVYARLWDDVNCNNRPDGGAVDVTVVFDESCSMEWENPFAECNAANNTAAPDKIAAAQAGARRLYQTLLDEGADAQIAFVSYNGQANTDNLYQMAPVTAANQSAYNAAVNATTPSNGTDISDGVRAGKNLVLGDAAEPTVNGISGAGNGARPDAEKVIVLLSDGFPNDNSYTGTGNPTGTAFTGDANTAAARAAIQAAQDARNAGITIYTLTYQLDAFPIPELVDLMGTGLVDLPPAGSASSGNFGFDTPAGQGFASTDSTGLVATIDGLGSLDPASSNAITDAFAEIAVDLAAGDDFLYQGSLAGMIDLLNGGVSLSSARNDVGEGPQCFDPGVYCYAFDWYFVCEPEDFELPSDVDGAATIGAELDAAGLPRDPNVAQTDSLRFELDLAATQCRHNMENANPFGGATNGTATGGS